MRTAKKEEVTAWAKEPEREQQMKTGTVGPGRSTVRNEFFIPLRVFRTSTLLDMLGRIVFPPCTYNFALVLFFLLHDSNSLTFPKTKPTVTLEHTVGRSARGVDTAPHSAQQG